MPVTLKMLTHASRQAIARASSALSTWLGCPASISIDRLELVPLPEAASVLGDEERLICACTVEFAGEMTGCMIMALDAASGFMLADLLLHQPVGTSAAWEALETSAVLETANIVCCAYLNAVADVLSAGDDHPVVLLPDPPQFREDFAACILEPTLLSQAIEHDELIIAHAAIEIDGAAVTGQLVFLPDSAPLVT